MSTFLGGRNAELFIYKPHLVYRDTGSSRLLTQKIDTAAILAACIAVNCYRDTLKNDTSALVVIENEVSMNELQRTRMEFLNRRDIIKYVTNGPASPSKFSIYAGFNFSIMNHKNEIGFSVFTIYKSKRVIGIEYYPVGNKLSLIFQKQFK